MKVGSRVSVAAAVTLGTLLVCFFGIRAELSQARRVAAARAHPVKPLEAPPTLARD